MDQIGQAYAEAERLHADALSTGVSAARLEALVEETPYPVAVDDRLGNFVEGLVEVARMKARAAAYEVEQVYALLK